jgi:hypothetical protein
MTTLGERFVQALAAKDFAGVAAVLHPEEEQDRIDTLVELEVGGFGDRDRVGWRSAVTTPDGPHLVEQQAFYSATGGQIGWMRVMCSGFRPTSPA